MTKSESQKSESPSQLIDARIKELGDWRGEMLGRLRGLIKEADPEVVEEWKWRGVPVWSHDGMVCTGETYKNIVKLTFTKGAALKDPSDSIQLQSQGEYPACHRLPRGREDQREGAQDPLSRHGGPERVQDLTLIHGMGTGRMARLSERPGCRLGVLPGRARPLQLGLSGRGAGAVAGVVMATRLRASRGSGGSSATGLTRAVVEFAAAYASGCEPGPIVVGHDGRVTAAGLPPAVLSAITATGRDVLLAGRSRRPPWAAWCSIAGRSAASRSRPRTTRRLQRPQVLRPRGDGPQPRAPARRPGTDCLAGVRLGALGSTWHRPPIDDPDAEHLAAVLATVDVDAIRSRAFAVALDACHGAGGRLGEALLEALGCTPIVVGGSPTADTTTRPSRPSQPRGLLRDRPGRRRGRRLRAGPRRRPPGDRRRERPLHRRGTDPGPGRLAHGSPRSGGRSC